ncbi:MAG: phosphoribosylformylglycinamidine cyclo-ligase [Homoserinimonas sp.]|nr:phosphoribosylformylglycinamidine cyclo-ligase [Homoserinimonas sp.]
MSSDPKAGTGIDPYAAAGVDTKAGDLAVELMKDSIRRTHGPQVLGGVGGFAGLFDASSLKNYSRPLLASSTDGVGTKVAIASALDRHDTIGQDLVGMVVDDIVVVGAKPLFMTDYIACDRVVPERIAAIVSGIARACEATGTALVGGETAEHPGLLGVDEYDLAGAVVGAVEADSLLGPERVEDGDVLVALASSGLHSNGYSLVRRILADRKLDYDAQVPEFDSLADVLLEPTRLYTAAILEALDSHPRAIHALSHITGGGIAANLARVLPEGAWAEIDRSSWTVPDVFQVLAGWGGLSLEQAEGTWNLGIGMIASVDPDAAAPLVAQWSAAGIPAWIAGIVSTAERNLSGFEHGAKGVTGGAVRLIGRHR